MGLSSTLIYTSELILCSTICVPSATRHNIQGGVTRLAGVEFMLHLQAPKRAKSDSKKPQLLNVAARADDRGERHRPPKCVIRPPFSLFTCLATTQQRLVTSPRHTGVVSLHVNAGIFRPRLVGLPHLPGVPHLHVNRPLYNLIFMAEYVVSFY